MGLGHNDPWVHRMYLVYRYGVKSNITMIAKVCDRKSRRDSWFEKYLVIIITIMVLTLMPISEVKETVSCDPIVQYFCYQMQLLDVILCNISLIFHTEPGAVSGLSSTLDEDSSNTITISWEPITGYPCPGLDYIIEYQLISKDQCELETEAQLQLADPIDQSHAVLTGLEYHSTYLVSIKASHAAGMGDASKMFVQTGETGKTQR